jgi:DNA invertase Pin-like site-specific DNA recombinase
MSRYGKTRRTDLSQTLSGIWLAGLVQQLQGMEAPSGQLAIAAYLRLSVAKLSEQDHLKALQRQFSICQGLAKAMGGTITMVWCDMARTADSWKGSRPQFQLMVQALPEYSGLVASEFFRVARDNEDVGPLCRLYAETGNEHLLFRVPDRDYDPRTLTGRAAMQAEAARGLGELAEASVRQEKRHRQLRDEGRYVGHRPFGITGDDNDQLYEPEAKYARQACLDVIAGKTVADIQREWLEAGVLGVNGVPMTRQTIRDLLLSPRMVGLLVVRPKKGEAPKPIHECFYVSSITGEKVRSQLPPILVDKKGKPDDKTWQAVVEALRSRGKVSRGTSRKGKKAKYLLSGLCWCLACGEPMNGCWVAARKAHVYRCDKGCGTISGPGLDDYVTRLILTLWSERSEAVVPDSQAFPEQEALDYWRNDEQQVRAQYKARKLTLNQKNKDLVDIMEQLAPLEEAWMAWNKANVQPVATNSVDQWKQAPDKVHGRRLMLTGEIDRIEITKALVKGPQVVDETRVEVKLKGAPDAASAQLS